MFVCFPLICFYALMSFLLVIFCQFHKARTFIFQSYKNHVCLVSYSAIFIELRNCFR